MIPRALHPRLARRVQGQAMVETLVASLFFLVPLFLAIAALGKFIDVQHTAEMSARYGAWERTVWYEKDAFATLNNANSKKTEEIQAEMAVRLLHDGSAGKVIQDKDKNATTLANGTSPMWRDAAGKAYLENFADVTAPVTMAKPSKDVSGETLDKLGKIKVGTWASFVPPLPNNNLAVASISFKKVGATSEVYQRLWSLTPAWSGLEFNSTGAILSNTWSTNGSGSTHEMVKTMVPTAQDLGHKVLTAAKLGIGAWDPAAVWNPISGETIEVGKIAVDELPGDRLK